MDHALVPIVVFLIPIAAIVFSGLQKLARLRIEEARVRQSGGGTAEVEDLRNEVQQLRSEMAEVQERLDFAERLLARTDRPPLPEGQR
jgi:hypothetical protein